MCCRGSGRSSANVVLLAIFAHGLLEGGIDKGVVLAIAGPGAARHEREVHESPVHHGAAAFDAQVIAYSGGDVDARRIIGLVLLAMFIVYIVVNVRQMTSDPQAVAGEDEEEAGEDMPLPKSLILLAAGAALIAVGADLLVDNGTLIAQALGVPESVIALTFVALGTSLPELVTAITSLAKGHGALSLGNVIGANLFNLVLVSGVAVTLAPFPIPVASTIAGMNASLVMDLPVMFGVMLLLTVPALVKGRLYRLQGVALLAVYAAFCVAQFAM